MMASLSTLALLTQVALGWTGHHAPRSACCDVCGVETFAVATQIRILQTHPNWRERDDAAHELRDFDWRCHPEIPAALVNALLHDCEEEVREESAQTLTKIAPCVPEVHAALVYAAQCDPDHATRKWARRALRNLDKRCIAACDICGPMPPGAVAPSPYPAPYPAPVVEPPLTTRYEYVAPPVYSAPIESRSSRYVIPGPPSAPYDPIESSPIGSPEPPEVILPPEEGLPPLTPPREASPFVVPPAATRPEPKQEERDRSSLAEKPRSRSLLFRIGQRLRDASDR